MPVNTQLSYDEKFEQIYQSLNANQKDAVNHIDGPTMVIAGPGTGKTQILAARIANILKQTDTAPYQILCVTFTDAGVVAMRSRLESFIGPIAYQVNIHTFHSLCNQIILENTDYFGYKSVQAASDLEILQIISEIIDELPAQHPIKRLKGEVYLEAVDLKILFSIMKKEDFSVDFIKTRTDKHLEDMLESGSFYYKRAYKDKKAGDLKEDDYNKELEKHERLKAAADLYNVFTQKMKDKGWYDFDDMILWVINAFKNDPSFLLNYQEQFLYYLVDEFQDTNGSQLELINLLAKYDDNPNLFVVGDEDQSIYRFQGANINNIIDFEETYKNYIHTTVLTDNYRSSQSILDASKSLISYNSERITSVDKVLLAKGSINGNYNKLPPSLQVYQNDIQEMVGIGHQIKALHQQGVPYKNIAVLYRNHKHVDDLVAYFDIHQIPYNSFKKVNVLEELLIKKLLTILQYIEAENKKPFSGEAMLFQILNYDFYNIHPLDIAKISVEVSKSRKKWREFLGEKAQITASLFDTVSSKESKAELNRLVSDLEYWIKQSNNLTLPQLVEKIIAKGGVLSYVMHAPDKRWQLQVLRTFFDFVKAQAAKNPQIAINDLVQLVEEYNRFSISLDAIQMTSSPDSVNLMTLHKSKGLEFEYVFMIKCTESDWTNKNKNKRDFNISKYVSTHSVTSGDQKDIEELRRLFFVGMTRAKKELFISYYSKTINDKDVSKLQFVSELIESAGLQEKNVQVDETELFDFESAYYRFDETPDFDLIDHAFIDEILKNYMLSVTHLNSYLKCPITFYFNNVLRVPSAKNENLAFGTAIHAAFESLLKAKAVQSEMPDVSIFITGFVKSMHQNRDSFTDKSFERLMLHGKEVLTAYYNNYQNELAALTTFDVEKNLNSVNFDGIPLKGKLDCVILDGSKAFVVDFKTGKYENAKRKCKPPKEGATEDDKFELQFGGDYWRQMMFYALLIKHDERYNKQMIGGEMDFVEPVVNGGTSKFFKEKFQVLPNELAIVEHQIKDTYFKIKNHEFEKGCGDESCDWCNFVKFYLKKEVHLTNQLPGSQIEEE
jgi:DNA helicase-2/ATP-dependent DNA helicase PcrA